MCLGGVRKLHKIVNNKGVALEKVQLSVRGKCFMSSL